MGAFKSLVMNATEPIVTLHNRTVLGTIDEVQQVVSTTGSELPETNVFQHLHVSTVGTDLANDLHQKVKQLI